MVRAVAGKEEVQRWAAMFPRAEEPLVCWLRVHTSVRGSSFSPEVAG